MFIHLVSNISWVCNLPLPGLYRLYVWLWFREASHIVEEAFWISQVFCYLAGPRIWHWVPRSNA